MEFAGNGSNSENLRESEEGVEVKLFLQTLKRIYHVNESAGTYVCSKMKNFMNNYRHKTKRLIFEGLRANKIISSKVNDIIDTSLKESNFEKVFESLSDLYYTSDFNRTVGNPAVCKVQPQKNQDQNISTCSEVQSFISDTPTESMSEVSAEPQDSVPSGSQSSGQSTEDERTKRVFVEIGSDTHVVHLKEFNTITRLKGNLVEELKLGKDELKPMDIKYFSKGLKKWTILKSWKVLKTDETIKINSRKVETDNPPHFEVEDPLSIEPQDPPPLLYQKDNNDLQPAIPLEQQIEEVVKEYSGAGGEKSWVLNFKLPLFEEKFVTQMEKGEITSKERIDICQIIQKSVVQHDQSPTSTEIAIIMKILFLTYPKLAEMDKDYWVTWNIWKVSLSEAFTKNRMKEASMPLPVQSKTKSVKRKSRPSGSSSHRPKKKNSNNSASSSSSSVQKVELHPDPNPEEAIMEVVSNEDTSRTLGPMDHLSPAMQLTFEERRRQVVDEGWSIQDVLISYPWLHSENEIFAEFSRIVDLDKTVDKAIDAGFRKIVYAVLHSLRSHPKYRTVLEKEKELRKETDKKGDFEYKMTLFALPFAFGEDIEDIFKQEGSVYEEPIQIEFSGGSRYEDGKSFAVIIEDAKVECSSLKKAVAVFVASFFIFNLTYPSDIKKFLYFIERNLLGIPGKALPPSQVVKMVKKIDDYFDGQTEA